MRVSNEVLLSAGDMSQATLTSTALNINQVAMMAIQAVFTGAPVGSLKFQASLDNVTFTDLASPSAVAISAAGSSIVNIPDTAYNYIRCVYTKTSGTGALTIVANTKGF